MRREFVLEDPGEGIHEAEIIEIKVSSGDKVAEGQELFIIETDKAAIDVPSPFSGVIAKIPVAEGDIVKVGDVLAVFEDAERDTVGIKQAETDVRHDEAPDTEKAAAQAATSAGGKTRDSEDDGDGPDQARGREDGGKAAAQRGAGDANAEDVFGGEAPPADLFGVGRGRKGSNPAQAEKGREKEHDATAKTTASAERVPLRSIRRATAKRMVKAWTEIPHVTHQDSADITDLDRMRNLHNRDHGESSTPLSLTAMIVKAVASTLHGFPRFNASLDVEAEEILLQREINIGVAVDTDDGLLVPVLRSADRKPLVDLAGELAALAEKAREGAMERRDMVGGTFTVTNVGAIGGTGFTPIINYPQAAILGVGAARLTPAVREGQGGTEIVPRLMLPLCLAFDHRLNDGAAAARLTSHLVHLLSDTDAFMMGT